MDSVPQVAIGHVAPDWPLTILHTFRHGGLRQAAYVPDAGHSRLIRLMHADAAVRTVVLTTEEKQVALAAGAWLGGMRAMLLMQSSGVGDCINTLARW